MADNVKYLDLRIVTPLGDQHSFKVKHVKIPGGEGDFGVLSGHLPIISSLRIGIIEFEYEGSKKYWTCTAGYCEVADDRVTVLTEVSENASEIDVNRAKQSLERARKRLQEKSDDLNIKRAQMSLMRSENRVRAASVLH